jgi:hypothetical protein
MATTVTKEVEMSLTEAFDDETPINVRDTHSLDVTGSNHVRLDPHGEHWWVHEFELGDTPWRVYNVSESENGGVAVEFVREE